MTNAATIIDNYAVSNNHYDVMHHIISVQITLWIRHNNLWILLWSNGVLSNKSCRLSAAWRPFCVYTTGKCKCHWQFWVDWRQTWSCLPWVVPWDHMSRTDTSLKCRCRFKWGGLVWWLQSWANQKPTGPWCATTALAAKGKEDSVYSLQYKNTSNPARRQQQRCSVNEPHMPAFKLVKRNVI